MKITAEWLEQHKACEDQVEIFRRTYPGGIDSADVTESIVLEAVEKDLRVGWLVNCISGPARVEYDRVTAALGFAEFYCAAAPALARAIREGLK